jgi:hypothetical protein
MPVWTKMTGICLTGKSSSEIQWDARPVKKISVRYTKFAREKMIHWIYFQHTCN